MAGEQGLIESGGGLDGLWTESAAGLGAWMFLEIERTQQPRHSRVARDRAEQKAEMEAENLWHSMGSSSAGERRGYVIIGLPRNANLHLHSSCLN